MQRMDSKPRKNWVKTLQNAGIPNPIYESDWGTEEPDWREDGHYLLSTTEVADLVSATEEVGNMINLTIGHVVNDQKILDPLKIPSQTLDMIKKSWENGEKNLAVRLDWTFDKLGRPRLMEINSQCADGMTLAGPVQSDWAKENDLKSESKIEEALIVAFKAYGFDSHTLYFVHAEEDVGALIEVNFMLNAAKQAGLKVELVHLDDVGVSVNGLHFTDSDDQIINAMVMWARWEHIVDSNFGEMYLRPNPPKCQIIEPGWTMLAGNKAFLALMYHLHMGSEVLLPTYLDFDSRADSFGNTYVKKPIFGFDGANVEIIMDDELFASNPDDEADSSDGYILQRYTPLPKFGDAHAVVQTWLIAGKFAGISIREGSEITDYYAPMVPHGIYE